jgi:hypothetical protein
VPTGFHIGRRWPRHRPVCRSLQQPTGQEGEEIKRKPEAKHHSDGNTAERHGAGGSRGCRAFEVMWRSG